MEFVIEDNLVVSLLISLTLPLLLVKYDLIKYIGNTGFIITNGYSVYLHSAATKEETTQ